MPNKLEKALRTQNKSKANKQVELSGTMGIVINGIQTVEVPTRSGFVYVLLNTKEQELIQAFNDKVSGVYGLAVIVVWKTNRYEVLRKDDIRYGTWNSSYLPKHGNQHSFNPDDGGGGDVSFIYGKQFVPLSLTPSGTFGAPVAIIAGYSQQESGWHYIPNTTTPNITNHKPTDNRAKMVLVALDWQTRTAQLIIGTGTFAASLTGSADVIPYLPSTTGVYQVPIAGVRLVSGTTAVTWQNIYDVRQYFHPVFTGSAAGAGSSINAMDDGISIGAGSTFDFGDNISATRSGTVIRVDVSAPIQTDGFLVQDEGVLLGTGTVLNFVGAGVTATLGGTVFNINIPGGGGAGFPSLLSSTKALADTPDDEFSSTTLDPKWTVVQGQTGTVTLIPTQPQAGIYDLTTRDDWLLLNVGTGTAHGVKFRQDYTLPEGKCIVMPIFMGFDYINAPAATEVRFGLALNIIDAAWDSGGTTGSIAMYLTTTAGLRVSAPGFSTWSNATAVPNYTCVFFRIDRSGGRYYGFWSLDGYAWHYNGESVSNVAALNNLWILAEVANAITNKMQVAIPWIRQGEALAVDPWTIT
jgi:hypothetical protein